MADEKLVMTRLWASSLDGFSRYFRIECSCPLDPDELQDILDLLDIVKRQLSRSVAPKDSPEGEEPAK